MKTTKNQRLITLYLALSIILSCRLAPVLFAQSQLVPNQGGKIYNDCSSLADKYTVSINPSRKLSEEEVRKLTPYLIALFEGPCRSLPGATQKSIYFRNITPSPIPDFSAQVAEDFRIASLSAPMPPSANAPGDQAANGKRSYDERHADVMRCVGETTKPTDPRAGVAACTTAIAEMTVDGARTRFYGNRGAWHMKLKEYAAAEADFDEVFRRDPKDDDSLTQLATARVYNKNFSGAVEAAQIVTRRQPKSGLSWILLSYAESELGHMESAIAANDQAMALEPTNEPLLHNACSWRVQAKLQLDAAMVHCDSWVRQTPTFEALWYRAGGRLITKNYSGAAADYDAAYRLKPLGTVLYARGLAKFYLGREEEGRADMEAGTKLDPKGVADFGGVPPQPASTAIRYALPPQSAPQQSVAITPGNMHRIANANACISMRSGRRLSNGVPQESVFYANNCPYTVIIVPVRDGFEPYTHGFFELKPSGEGPEDVASLWNGKREPYGHQIQSFLACRTDNNGYSWTLLAPGSATCIGP